MLVFSYSIHDNLQVKVGDSALSWDLYPDDYQMLSTGEMIAIKWQPVEVLSDGHYTMYSDVVCGGGRGCGWGYGWLVCMLNSLIE